MEKELNLVEILKDCPQGTKLYSIMHGEVVFDKIYDDFIDVFFYDKDDDVVMTHSFLSTGQYCPTGECVLFPSKDQRDWLKFYIEPEELIDGEIYFAKTNLVEWVYIYKRNNTFKTNHYVAVLNDYLMEFNNICTTHNEDIKILRKATEEEKRLFFEIIEKNGRKWDVDKKELVRIEEKFDVSSLQHFDKVLVRDCNTHRWKCDFFDSYVKELKSPFRTTYSWYTQCVPYNDETKYLASTTEIPPKKYINWEE